ncbi:hypothetical protein SLEP1_g17790 [Rubroshorea leprosula]|uniref:Uncharacterized protein n=1 Tax=Rubroshorea leprosula TaxID=152421 RepID=A0AAV5J4L6_9ROSI|nr:hypothetical protein SLEP1_g17790 [Rubroshorea leprosula]
MGTKRRPDVVQSVEESREESWEEKSRRRVERRVGRRRVGRPNMHRTRPEAMSFFSF